MSEIKLKPCPFCGGNVNFLVLDDEFNVHPEDYEEDPWSGLQYGLNHDDAKAGCPIATQDGELLGIYGWDTKEEAAEAWNYRQEMFEDA